MFCRTKRCAVAFLMICGLLVLAGCNDSRETKQQEEKDETIPQKVQAQETSQKNYYWLITIDQTNNEPFAGSLGDGSIPAENTIHFVAVNSNESPYDGEFRGYAEVKSFTDIKEAFGISNAEYVANESEHKSELFTFTLVPKDLASLTKTEETDSLLSDVSTAEFYMPTTGDNPVAVSGSVQGYAFSVNDKLDFSVTCNLTQINSKIELKTDMFGTFTGAIERVSADESEIDLAPLTESGEGDEIDLAPLTESGE